MKNIVLILLITLTTVGFSFGQASDNGHFLVTFEEFTPPTQDNVRSFEGQPAEQFMANDVNGKEHFLGNYKGKKVILWFFSTTENKAVEQIGAMTLLQQSYKNLKVIGFAKERKGIVQDYLRENPMEIDVIPNGEVFGQMAYGASMGNPRMFIIDEDGIIKVVLPSEAFVDNSKLYVSLESILGGL